MPNPWMAPIVTRVSAIPGTDRLRIRTSSAASGFWKKRSASAGAAHHRKAAKATLVRVTTPRATWALARAARSSSAAAPRATNRTTPASSPRIAGMSARPMTVIPMARKPTSRTGTNCVTTYVSRNASPIPAAEPARFATAPRAIARAPESRSVRIGVGTLLTREGRNEPSGLRRR